MAIVQEDMQTKSFCSNPIACRARTSDAWDSSAMFLFADILRDIPKEGAEARVVAFSISCSRSMENIECIHLSLWLQIDVLLPVVGRNLLCTVGIPLSEPPCKVVDAAESARVLVVR